MSQVHYRSCCLCEATCGVAIDIGRRHHPDDARPRGLVDGARAQIATDLGEIEDAGRGVRRGDAVRPA